jgi:hypothetical protein
MFKEEGYIFVWEKTTFFCSEYECKKIYTNIQGMWNRLVHRSEKRRLCVSNKIVRMEALIVLGEFSLIKQHIVNNQMTHCSFFKSLRKFSYLHRQFSLLLMFSKAWKFMIGFFFFVKPTNDYFFRKNSRVLGECRYKCRHLVTWM